MLALLAGNADWPHVNVSSQALRHSKVKLTWDADDPERERVTRQAARGLLTKDQLRDDDFRAYLASGTESEGEDDKTKGRDRLRALLHLDGNDDDEEEDEEDQGAGDLQITFMPGLSEAASRKARGEKKGDEEETTLEKYMRKQRERREKKKQSRSGKDDENEVEEDAGAGAISGGADAAGFNDPFFESDPEMDMEAALRAEEGGVSAQSAKKGKDKKKERKGKDKKGASEVQDAEEDPAAAARARAELELMVDSDSGDEAIGGRRHFDMKDIIRSEQGKDKKSRKRGKRGKAGAGEDDKGKGSKSARDDFQINTQDPRFAALHEDHRFAIDPSNPHFIKTNSMQKLLDERRRQQERKRGSNIAAPSEERKSSNGARNGASNNDLGALVQSIKKRAAAGQDPRGSGSGKKRRT